MKKLILFLISAVVGVCLSGGVWGQILTFEFSALAGGEASAVSNSNDANLTSSTITRGAGLTASANAQRYNATDWAITSIANAVSGNDYMAFTITPNSGYQFSVSSIVVQWQRSGTGNTAISLRSSVDGYTTDLDAVKSVVDNTSTQTFTWTFTQANSATAVTYRLYSYAEATGGTGGPGDGTGNDIVVNGTVTSTATPTITLNPTTLTGFNYTEDAGPSGEQTFTVTGTNLTNNISITASTNYEISKTSGSGYASPLTFTQSGGTVSSTTVYVRLKSGLTAGTYNSETITATSTGATDKTVTCSGTVVDYPNWCNVQSPGTGTIATGGAFNVYARIYEPGLTTLGGSQAAITCWIGYSTSNSNPNTWTNWVAASFNAEYGNDDEYVANIGPSCIPAGTYYYASRFTINGGATYSYGGFSAGGGGFYDGSTYVNGTLTVNANYPDWVNLQWPASGSISVGGTYNVYAQVFETGVTEAAGAGANISGWIGYNATNNNPSGWTNWVAATFNSQQGNNDEFMAEIGSALPAGTYYYASRFKVNPNANEYSYGGYNSGAWNGTTNVNGVLTITEPTITVNPTTLTGYTYVEGSGPSTEQTFTISGANLTANISIAAPTNYEISLSSGSGYTTPLTLTPSGGTVSNTTVYVRLKSGLSAGNYNSETITASSTGATNKTVTCSGTVTAASSYCYEEYFAGFSAGTHASPNSTDVSGSLNTYTSLPGWTGASIYQAGGEIKLGSSSVKGIITTPTLDLSAGDATLYFDASSWTGDATALKVFHATDGVTFVQVGSNISLTESFVTQTITISGGTNLSKIRIEAVNASSDRYYLDNFKISCAASCTAPTTQASAFTSGSITSSGMTVGWTRGNGTAGVIVVARSGSAVNADPVSGTDYTANAAFSSGTQIGTGNYVVYKGTGTSVAITGLTSATTYHYAVYEYNTTDLCYNKTELTGNATTTCSAPTTQATNLTFSPVANTSMTASWTIGNGSKRIVIMNTSNSFTNPSDGTDPSANTVWANSGQQVIYNGTGTSVAVTGLSANTTYWFRVYEANCSGASILYYTNTATNNPNSQTTTNVPDVALANNGTQVAAASVLRGTNNHILHQFQLSVTVANAQLTGMGCTTAGTYASADITNLKVWYSTNATFESGTDVLLSTLTTPGTAGAKTFSSFTSQTINSGNTGYIFITADISATAISGNTINLSAITTSNLTFTSANKSGSSTAGGTQTIVKAEPSNNATSFLCGTTTASAITFTWTDAVAGAEVPDRYLILYNTSGTFSDPVDGTAQADAAGKKNINYGVQTVTISGLSESTTYYFKIFPYTNSGTIINYKTDDTVLTGSCVTTANSACGTQNFSGGTTEPAGWTFTNIGATYTTSSCSSGTSLKFDATGDAVETATVNNPTYLSFNILGNGLSAPNVTSSLLVQGWNGSSWVLVDDLTGTDLTNTCQIIEYTSGIGTYTKFKFTYTKGTGNLSFDDVSINCAGGPTISVGTITSFGNVCTGSTTAEKSYIVSGTLLTDDIIITPPVGFEISTTSGSGFISNPSTLTLTESSGTVNATSIYVRFSPSAVQSYDGNIIHTSTDAVDKNVALVGSGVNNLTPSISTPTSANLTISSADLGGNITSIGCANVTKRGIFWSTTNGFADGAGTEVSETAGAPYSTGAFSINVSGLSASTVYYYKAFAQSSIGTVYTTQGTFTTLCSNVTLPYTQGFNSTTIPTCWSETVVNDPGVNPTLNYQASNTYPLISTPQEGTQFVKFNSYDCADGAEIRLVSPPVTTTGLSGISADFIWYESPNYSTYLLEGMTVQYSLNGGTTWVDVEFFQRYNAISGWKDKTCVMPAAVDNQSTVLFGFLFHSEYGYDCVMDDIYIYTCNEPTTNPTVLSFSNITNSTIDLGIGTPGNGTKRIIVAREGAAVNFTPTDNTTYSAVSVFADATDLGSGNKVVYNGTGTSVTVSGLEGNTTYYFKVFEYNCSEGNENFYTGGTILAGSTTTLISPVTNLQVLCQTNTTAEISWTAPVGDYTGVIISMRNDALVPHSISDNAANYTADVIFGDGTEFGLTSPKSYVVYKGTGTSVTVTGLTPGEQYSIKAYAYLNATGSTWSATQPTTSIANLSTADVTGNFVLTGNAELQLQWTNPGASCFDEVMIVGNAGSAITTQPSGDGSAYTGNSIFGSGTAYGTGYVVYKGGFSPQTITNLTNGVEYCFTWFVRNGTTWSTGVSNCGTPTTVTILEPGDLAIVAVNTQAQSSGSADEICFFAFKDITVGTSIDFTDNGYERLYDGKWASSEGTLRMTRTGGGTITAGQVICFQGQGSTQAGFDVFTCGTEDNANWTITSLNNVGATSGSYDLNVDDQIWIMQNGAWDNGGSLSTHNATYSGNVLYGWTATGWFASSGYDDTHGSTLYPECECFNTNVAVAADHSKVKYIGDITTTSQFEWLTRINDDANWQGYSTNALYFAARDYSGTCFTLVSNAAISGTPGVWTGADNEDWFDCGNWQNLRIPTGSNNVTVSGAVGNHITVDDGISSMPEAECNNLTIAADALVGATPVSLKVNNSGSVLNIYGNFENNQVVQHTAGEIHFGGNFVNNDTYTHTTAGTAVFNGSGAQALTGAATFYNLKIDNSSSGVTINNDVTVNNILTLTDGLISTGANKIIIESNNTGSVTGQSTASYINGNIRRKVAATGSYDLPVGSSTYYELANIVLTTSTITYLDAKFTSPHSGTTLPTSPYLTVDGTDLFEMLNSGFWTITPVSGNATSYDVTLTSRGHTNGGALATQHTIVKRADSGSAWASYQGNHDNATQSGTGSNPITAKLTVMNGFSDFAIAKSKEFPLPVELLKFEANVVDKEVELNWITVSELNNDYFEIERTRDGIEYETIGQVDGAGNSAGTKYYMFMDYNPFNGISYYRLKQVDYNGDFAYSNIESVIIDSGEKLSVSTILDPNYAACLLIENPNGGNLNLSICDMSGKVIYGEKLDGNNESFTLTIQKSRLSPGIYLFRVYSETESVTQKVIVF